MSALDWLKLDVAKYLSDTNHLNTTQHGAYCLLIMHYWSRRGLPEDDEQLASIVRMTRAEWKKAKPVIQSFFHSGWKHLHLDKDLLAAATGYARRAGAGKAGGIAAALLRNKHASGPCELQPENEEELQNDSNATSNATKNGSNASSIESSNSLAIRGRASLVDRKENTSLDPVQPSRREAKASVRESVAAFRDSPPTLSDTLVAVLGKAKARP